MADNKRTYQEIEDYLQGRLDEDSLAQFEAELNSSGSLQQQVQAHRLADELVIENRLRSVNKMLKAEQSRALRRKRIKIASGIAGALLMAGITGWYLLNNSDNTVSQNNNTTQTKNVQIAKDTSHTPDTHTQSTNFDTVSRQPAPGSGTSLSKKQSKTQPETAPAASQKEQKHIAGADTGQTPAKTSGENMQAVKKQDDMPVTGDSISTGKAVQDSILPVDKRQKSVHKDSNTTEKQPTSKEDPCAGVHIAVKYETEAACPDKQEGAIRILQVKGGQAPYSYAVSGPDARQEDMHALAAGMYTLKVEDAHQCKKVIDSLKIPVKQCFEEDSFNPYTGEKWKVPAYKARGNIVIRDQNGSIYLQKTLAAGRSWPWDGKGSNGRIKSGYYLYEINYHDGTTKRGSITIIR